MSDWFYCYASRPILYTAPRQYRECGTWCHEDDCGTEYDRDTRTYSLTCPECGSTEISEAFRCAFTDLHGDQCTEHCADGYSMCTAHLAHDDDWQEERAEHTCDDDCRSYGCPRTEAPCPF